MNIAAVILLAKVSQYLAQEDIDNQKYLHGGSNDDNLPTLIYVVRRNVEWLYNINPSHVLLDATANYLYGICKYTLQANKAIGHPGENVAVKIGGKYHEPLYIKVGRGKLYDPVDGDTTYINPELELLPTSKYTLFSSANGKPLFRFIDYTPIEDGWTLIDRIMNQDDEFTMIFDSGLVNGGNELTGGLFQNGFTSEDVEKLKALISVNTTEDV